VLHICKIFVKIISLSFLIYLAKKKQTVGKERKKGLFIAFIDVRGNQLEIERVGCFLITKLFQVKVIPSFLS